MIQVDMSASVRDQYGKGAARSLRRQGRTPAVLYGPKADAVALDVETKGFTKRLIDLQRRNAIFNLSIAGKDGKEEVRHVIVQELQTDPVNDELVHADFLEIPLKEPLTLSVQLQLIGHAKGVDLGGIVMTAMHTVSLRGLILDFPDYIEVDVADLDVGDAIHCKDLNIPDTLELLDDVDASCVSVVLPTREEEVVEEEVEGEEEGAEAAGAEGAAEGDAKAEAPADAEAKAPASE
jgi:large subunit ribosomal protein L25